MFFTFYIHLNAFFFKYRNRRSASAMTSWWKRGRRKWSEWRIIQDGKLRRAGRGSTMKGNFQKSASRESSRNAFRGTMHFTHHWSTSSYCWCATKHCMLSCAGLLLQTPAAMWTPFQGWWGLPFLLRWTVVWSLGNFPNLDLKSEKGQCALPLQRNSVCLF